MDTDVALSAASYSHFNERTSATRSLLPEPSSRVGYAGQLNAANDHGWELHPYTEFPSFLLPSLDRLTICSTLSGLVCKMKARGMEVPIDLEPSDGKALQIPR